MTTETEEKTKNQVDLNKMKLTELKDYARDNNIDLGNLTLKADILKQIKEPVENPQPSAKENQRYIFDRITCPRCGSADTKAMSTQGRTQYRKCRFPVCQINFTVRGRPAG